MIPSKYAHIYLKIKAQSQPDIFEEQAKSYYPRVEQTIIDLIQTKFPEYKEKSQQILNQYTSKIPNFDSLSWVDKTDALRDIQNHIRKQKKNPLPTVEGPKEPHNHNEILSEEDIFLATTEVKDTQTAQQWMENQGRSSASLLQLFNALSHAERNTESETWHGAQSPIYKKYVSILEKYDLWHPDDEPLKFTKIHRLLSGKLK